MRGTMNKWDLTGFVTASSYRRHVVQALSAGERTPTELADVTPVEITHVSRALSELREKDLVELRVPESQQKSRYYGLTDKGREIARNVQAVMNG